MPILRCSLYWEVQMVSNCVATRNADQGTQCTPQPSCQPQYMINNTKTSVACKSGMFFTWNLFTCKKHVKNIIYIDPKRFHVNNVNNHRTWCILGVYTWLLNRSILTIDSSSCLLIHCGSSKELYSSNTTSWSS